jgi:hypothetical protein
LNFFNFAARLPPNGRMCAAPSIALGKNKIVAAFGI